jgi:hypothetical protein
VDKVLRASKESVKQQKDVDFQQMMKASLKMKPKKLSKDDPVLLHDLYQHTIIIPLDDLRGYVQRLEKEGIHSMEDIQKLIKKGFGENDLIKNGIEKRHARALLQGVREYRKTIKSR